MSRTVKATIRWSLKQASEEFGVNIQTLTRKLKSNDALPGPDKQYSTRQIYDALAVDIDLKRAQLEDTREAAKLKRTRRETLERKNVPIELVEKVWADYVIQLREKIQNLPLPAKERSDILADLQVIPKDDYWASMSKVVDDEEDEE